MKKIGIIDYGMGNLHSVENAFKYIGASCFISDDKEELSRAEGLILPGVGAFPDASERLKDSSLFPHQSEFLKSVIIAYNGLKNLILRYEEEALTLLRDANEEEKAELLEIARVCRAVSGEKPSSFREAIQLLWFTHLAVTVESFEFVNYGRLDVILAPFIKNTDRFCIIIKEL